MTARDVAAALHLVEIYRAARSGGEVEIEVFTQMPATEYFRRAGCEGGSLDIGIARTRQDPQADVLLEAARRMIDRVRPDAVLCGLSTPRDGGIDEAVLATFDGPSFVFQDFWGEANGFFGKKADVYLALDAEGVRLTQQRHDIEAIEVGSPRHSAYVNLNVFEMRERMRKKMPFAEKSVVYGYFGQALHFLNGYRRTVDAWVDAVRRQPADAIVMYRPHPREQREDVSWTIDRFTAAGLRVVVLDKDPVEYALLSCDVVCSAFSNCTYDAAYLSRFSSAPLFTPISLFFDEEVILYFKDMLKLEEFPYIKGGLVLPVHDVASLSDILARASTASEKQSYWSAAQKLKHPSRAPGLVLDAIRKRLAR